jgi:hypothetical protein
MASAPLAPRPSGFQTGVVVVNVQMPANALGAYSVQALVTVVFSADSANPSQTYMATGDTEFCIMEPAPSDPTIPRLDVVTVSDPNHMCRPGHQLMQKYKVINNDLVNPVSLMVMAFSEQNARLPIDPGTNMGVPSHYSISGPVPGDDFPIDFAEDLPMGGIQLPSDPSAYDQQMRSKMIAIAPGGYEIVKIATRSYPMCADGSCGEYLVKFVGSFQNGDPALACIGGGVTVDSAELMIRRP